MSTGMSTTGPEIAATDEALGQKVKQDMDALNTGPAGVRKGVWYAENYKDAYPKHWKDDYWTGYADPAYFGKIGFMDWILKPGKSASEAVKSWLKGRTIAECNSSLVAIENDALRAA